MAQLKYERDEYRDQLTQALGVVDATSIEVEQMSKGKHHPNPNSNPNWRWSRCLGKTQQDSKNTMAQRTSQ